MIRSSVEVPIPPAYTGGGTCSVAIPTRAGDEGMSVNLGVRPEDLRMTDGPALFEGTVDLTEALGEVTLLYFGTTGDQDPFIAKLPGIHTGLNRQSVRLTADPETMHLFHDGQSLLYRDGPPTTPMRWTRQNPAPALKDIVAAPPVG